MLSSRNEYKVFEQSEHLLLFWLSPTYGALRTTKQQLDYRNMYIVHFLMIIWAVDGLDSSGKLASKATK